MYLWRRKTALNVGSYLDMDPYFEYEPVPPWWRSAFSECSCYYCHHHHHHRRRRRRRRRVVVVVVDKMVVWL